MKGFTITLALALAASLAAFATPGQASQTLDVCPSGCTYATIQSAVDAAAPGDTVSVGPGTYAESVVVDKAISLLGAKQGLNAKTRPTTGESIVDAPGTAAITVSAGGVLVDGFSLVSSCATGDRIGLLLQNSDGPVTVKHNRIGGNTIGVALYGVAPAHFERNFLFANNCPGAASGNGFYGDVGSEGLRIVNNDFTGHANAAIVLAGPVMHVDVLVKGNRLVNDNSIALFAVEGSRIEGNLVTGSAGSAIFLGGGVLDLLVTGNEISGGLARGIRVLDTIGWANDNVVLRFNKIQNNALEGVFVDVGAHDGTLDARSNWWGTSLGPNGGGWGGSGEEVVGDVDAVPFCLDGGCSANKLLP